jgi:hypothetical protein
MELTPRPRSEKNRNMGLLNFLWPPRRTDSVLGELSYRHRAWNGEISIARLCEYRLPLEIQTAPTSDLAKFQRSLRCISENIQSIKDQIAQEAFETYKLYVDGDVTSGNFSIGDYARHPRVASATEIWCALKPFRLTLTDSAQEYDAMIWLDVDWPNPHYFVACLKDASLYVLEVDG